MKTFEPIPLIFAAYNEAARIANTLNEAVTYFEKQALDYETIVPANGSRELVNQTLA